MDGKAKLHLIDVAKAVVAHKTRYYGYAPKQIALPAARFAADELPAAAAALGMPTNAMRLSHDTPHTTVTGQDSVVAVVPFVGE